MSARLALALAMGLVGEAAGAAVELSVEDAALAEGNSGTSLLPFSIRRTGSDIASSQLIFQAWTVDDSATADAPSDYVSLPSTTLRITADADQLALEVGLRGDVTPEADEHFVLKLSDAVLTGADPSFSGPTGFPVDDQFLVQHQPVAIAQGDVNGDGRPDIAVANNSIYSRDAAVLLNTTAPGATTPSFSGPQNFQTGHYSGGVALGDLNGDNKPDLVIANGGGDGLPGSVSVLLNTTATGAESASFSAATNYLNDLIAPCGPADATLGDLNGDSRLDLVVTCNASTSLTVLLNTTAAGASALSFSAAYSTALDGHNLGRIALADINTDGRLDAVLNTLAQPYGGHVVILLNTTTARASSASFGPLSSFPVGDGPGRVAVADLNDDGRPDLAVPIGEDSNADPSNPYHKPSRVTVLFNLTLPGAETAHLGALHEYLSTNLPVTAALTDVNGDGQADLFTDGFSGPLEMYLNATPRGATAPRLIATGTVPTPGSIADMVAADFNSDGREDVAIANWASGYDEASVLLNTTPQLPPGTDTSVVIARGEASGTILNDDGGGASSSNGGSSSSGGSTSSGGSGSGSGATGNGNGGGGADSETAGGGGALWAGDLLLALLAAWLGRPRRRRSSPGALSTPAPQPLNDRS